MTTFSFKDELKAIAAVSAKQTKLDLCDTKDFVKDGKFERNLPKEEEDDNTEDLKDMLALSGDLLDTDLVNSIINEDDDELTKNTGSLDALGNFNLFYVQLMYFCFKEA